MSVLALDQSTIKFLKTSQVITSVSFAVKELVENSLDAGAKNIEVNLFDDGLTHIEVKDDGLGISKDDAPFMALSSYTSKIKNFDDLNKLNTYGFRGEALHALSEVSQVTIITRSNNDNIATSYIINSRGNVEESDPCHRSVGTTVQVKELFKNFPVRRQTLLNNRRANQDLKYLEALLKSFGIIHYDLRITYRRNKQIVFIKPCASDLTESITNVFGRDMTSCLELIEDNFPEGRIQLMLPKKDLPETAPICQSGHQFIFINDRILVYKELEKLLNSKIHEYYLRRGITISKKCLYFLKIMVDPSNLDINLEPNKTKGFLKNEKLVMEYVEKMVMDFYQLDKSPETENNVSQETSINDVSSLNEINISDISIIDKENEWPACKKRKVEVQKRSSNNVACLPVNNGSEETNSKLPKVLNIMGPILSESDSNSDNEMNDRRERRSVALKRKKELAEFESNMRRPNETEIQEKEPSSIDTETLSQLPVVDLGEEFSQLSKDSTKETLMSTSLNSELMDDMDPLFLDMNLDECIDSKNETINSKTGLKQSILMLNISQTGETIVGLDKDNCVNDRFNQPSPNSWSRGRVPGLISGTDVTVVESNANIKPNNATGFRTFFSQVRPQLVKENPEMSVPQIASLLSNRWKEMSDEEKAHYHESAQARMAREELQLKKEKKEQQEKEKNRKRLLKMLKNMKSNSKDGNKESEAMRKKTITDMNISIKTLTDKFYRPKNSKKTIVIGPIKPSLWIVKISKQFYLLDVAKMFRKLNFTDHNSNETNAKCLEELLQRWTLEQDDMSILHIIDSKS